MPETLSRFVIHRKDLDSDELIVESDGLSIGSALGNDLLLNHPTVSRTHAGIREVEDAFWLTNLSQSNGTLLNGSLIDMVELQGEDTIQVGVFLLRLIIVKGELTIEVERHLDAFTAGNRGTQLLGDPLQAMAEGRATLMVSDISHLFSQVDQEVDRNIENYTGEKHDTSPPLQSPRTQAIAKTRRTAQNFRELFEGMTQEFEMNFDSLNPHKSKPPTIEAPPPPEPEPPPVSAKKTAISATELQRLLAQRQKGTLQIQLPDQGTQVTVQKTSRRSTGLLNKARLQRGMTGLLTSIMALPEEDQKEFQSAMNVFWERRKQVEVEAQKLHDDSILRPREPDPEIAKHNLHLGKKRYNWLPTRDLVRPWPRGFLYTFGAVTVVAILVAALAWKRAYSPGPISNPHSLTQANMVKQSPQVIERLQTRAVATALAENNCSSCHPVAGSMQAQCVNCHQTNHFNPSIIAAHEKALVGCVDCHTEHKGVNFQPSLVARSVCVDCHDAKPRHPKAVKADGTRLGAPHGGTIGYPVVNGEWKWTKPLNPKWHFPNDLNSREQFHLVHALSSTNQPWKCTGCHKSFASPEAARKINTNKCAVCHSVNFKTENRQLLDWTAVRLKLDCASCHPQHGEDQSVAALLHPSSGKKETVAYAPEGVYRGGKDWEWNSFASHFGGLSFGGWSLLFSVVPLALTGFLAVDALRRRKILHRLAGKVIKISDERKKFSDTRYAERWELLEHRQRARQSAASHSMPHPIINYDTCIGCHACILACPQDVLGFDDQEHHAIVVNYEQCMEDTGCQQACPTVPQSCVLINTKMEIREPPKPLRKSASEGFETEHVEGVYLVGDVSGVPLIRNAIKEGRAAMDKIAEKFHKEGRVPGADYDVAIIGMGPAGISATARASERRLSYVALEQGRKYATIAEKYPAGKYVAFNPFIIGESSLGSIRLEGPGEIKEVMLAWWEEAVNMLGLTINEYEGCKEIIQENGYFVVKTVKNSPGYRVRKVVLAVGNAGEPRKLGVPGEMDGRILYRLQDPSDYRGLNMVVVGAGNSAVEAAVDLVGKRQPDGTVFFPEFGGNYVTLVVRSDFPKDLTLENKMWAYYCMDKGRIKTYFGAGIREISEHDVVLEKIRDKSFIAAIPNDIVLAMIGSMAPKEFLSKIGIKYAGDREK